MRKMQIDFPRSSTLHVTRPKVLFSLLILALSTFSQAQDDIERKGLVLGISSGASFLNLKFPDRTQANTDLALNWKIGYQLNPNLALILNGAISVYEDGSETDDAKKNFGGIFPSAQYWPKDKFWVLGGVGIGTEAPVFYESNSNNSRAKRHEGFGAIIGAGYEIYRQKHRNRYLVIDIQARLTYGSIKLNDGRVQGLSSAFLVGINI